MFFPPKEMFFGCKHFFSLSLPSTLTPWTTFSSFGYVPILTLPFFDLFLSIAD